MMVGCLQFRGRPTINIYWYLHPMIKLLWCGIQEGLLQFIYNNNLIIYLLIVRVFHGKMLTGALHITKMNSLQNLQS